MNAMKPSPKHSVGAVGRALAVCLLVVLAMGAAPNGTPNGAPNGTTNGTANGTASGPKGEHDSITNPQQYLLGATLWTQTSAEYTALCLQAYNAALDRVKVRLSEKPKDEEGKPIKPLAVIVDIDETIVQISGYQAYLHHMKQNHSEELFEQWLRDHEGDLPMVPGAKDFLNAMNELNVPVFFVTNRDEKLHESTVNTLRKHGINYADLHDPKSCRLQCRTEGSGKDTRRANIEANYEVIAYIGDDLHDFKDKMAPKPGMSIAQRKAVVLEEQAAWGNRWFILPNPVYGGWRKMIKDEEMEALLDTLDTPAEIEEAKKALREAAEPTAPTKSPKKEEAAEPVGAR